MAIIFDVGFDQSIIHLVGVNNIIRFYSDTVTSDVKNAELTFPNNGSPIIKTIFQGPNNKFYYNLKELLQLLMNTNNFRDDINYSTQFVDWSHVGYRREIIEIKINFIDNSFETVTLDSSWLSMYLQYYNYRYNYYSDIVKNVSLVLKPKARDIKHTFKYWVGYPFTFGLYTGDYQNLGSTGELVGSGSPQNFTGLFPVTRFVVSNGISNFITLLYPINEMKFSFNANSTSVKFVVKKIIPTCYENRVYIKWINSFGDYDYWLFSKKPDIDRQTKSLGSLENDFNDFSQTTSPFEQIGVTGDDTLTVYDTLDSNDMVYIEDMLLSPKVYLFTGLPNQESSHLDWIEVSKKANTTQIASRKNNTLQFKLDLEMPELMTRKL